MSVDFFGNRKVSEAPSLNCQKICPLTDFLNVIFYQIEEVFLTLQGPYRVLLIHRIYLIPERTFILGLNHSNLFVNNCNRTDRAAILKDF